MTKPDMSDPYPLSLVCYTLSNLLSTAIFLGLASFVYLRGRTALLNRLFALWCISVSVWAFGVFNQSLASDPDAALRWSQLLHVAAACIPILFLHFILCYLHAKRVLLVVLYVVASGFVFAAIDSKGWLIRDVAPIGVFQFYPKAGPLYPAFLTYFSSCLFIAFFELWREYHGSSAIRRNQIRYLLVATVLGFAGGTTTFFYVYDIPIFPYGNYGLVTVCAAMIAYAIVKHRLINTSEVLHKGLTYGLLLPLIFAPTYVVVLLLIRVKTGTVDYVLAGMVLTAFMLCAATLEMFHKRLETAVAKTVFKQQYEAYETLTGFSQSMVRVLDLKALTDEIVRTVARAMNTPVASLYLWEKQTQLYRCVAFSGAEASPLRKDAIRVDEALSQALITTRILLVREELALGGDRLGEPMLDMMDGMGAEVCIPLINKERVIGFCNLGCRPARQMYSPADLDLLTTLGQNAAIAVDNARLYEDLRQLYEDLQQSQRLVLRTDRLRSLEIMAAGFAHEVRNPLTSIKTFVQLAPTRTEDLDFVTNFSAIVADDVLRIERLIQEILDYARYQHRQLSEEDVNELLNASIYFLQVKGEQQGITVVKCLDAELPRVTLDRQQIKQVFLNLFLNAFEAMTDKGGTLTLTSRALTKRTSEPYVQIEIRDTGCGIPAKDLDHIFDPFFTTKHESSEGREGTGLGLAIVHQIVVEHGGSIEVTSTVGVGTVFIIQLPCLPPPHLGPPPEP